MKEMNIEKMQLYIIDCFCNDNPDRDRVSATVETMRLPLEQLRALYIGYTVINKNEERRRNAC